jgi:NAD(P)-dependent dehydrogenase (short-subunit alcohol dehydrogenase family)
MGNESALVTGASSGIGEATVGALVRRGWRVWATVREDADGQRLIAAHGNRVRVVRCDITDRDEVAELGTQVVEAGPLTGLVNNAGIAVPAPLEYLPLPELRRQLEVNLVGQLAVTQAVLPAVRSAQGRIVTIGSIAGRIAGPILGAYSISKFGLVGMTDSLRAELAPSGIAVVLIEPGVVATGIWRTGTETGERLLDTLPPEAINRYRHQFDRTRAFAAGAAKRAIPPSAVAEVVVHALTAGNPRPRYVVGRDALVAATIARLPFRLRYRLTAARS